MFSCYTFLAWDEDRFVRLCPPLRVYAGITYDTTEFVWFSSVLQAVTTGPA
jgi:hypothetical protein